MRKNPDATLEMIEAALQFIAKETTGLDEGRWVDFKNTVAAALQKEKSTPSQ